MTAMQKTSHVATSECDREPIHIPGSIQPHGVLLACSMTSFAVTHASANAAEKFKKPINDILSGDLVGLLGMPLVVKLDEALARASGFATSPARLLGVKLKGRGAPHNLSIHAFEGRRIIEIEPAMEEPGLPPLELVRAMLGRLQQSHSIAELCEETARQLKELIGYDRVMIYRFLHDSSGQVVAEAVAEDLEPLLNLRYPASDIPAQARELYKRSWIRVISDVSAVPSPLVAAATHAKRPVDLSFAELRSVSPVHIQYLKNMRVGASMSISIIVGGELWGLIACHHRDARRVPANIRAAAELLGQVFSLQIQTVEGIEAYVTMRAARALLDRVVAEFPVDGPLIDNLATRLDQIAAFMPCNGAGVWIDGAWRSWRAAPSLAEIRALVGFMDSQRGRSIYATHNLIDEYPPAARWSCLSRGIMAIPLSHTNSDWLFFFRKEAAQVVEWAGDPNKPLLSGGNGNQLSPRASFAAWKEEVRGQSLPWTSRERLIGDTLRVYLLDIIVRFSEVILEERREAAQRQRLMTSELNHRVKGTLELIQSLLIHGYDGDDTMRDFVRKLEGRIRAIALAHDATSLTSGSDVRNLVEAAIALHGSQARQVTLSGPGVRLDPKAYTVVALVVHELVTNACAHGALSEPGGRLAVRWQIDAAGRLALQWNEEGGPPPPQSLRNGLGMLIIRRNIPHALGGEAGIELDDDGIRAAFVVPQRYILAEAPRPVPQEPRAALVSAKRQLDGSAVLIVEDQMPAALDLERMLVEHGAVSVQTVGTVAAACDLIEREPPDVAVLDIDLGDADSFVIADALVARGIPFIFAGSEYDEDRIPAQHQDVPVAGKPYSGDAVSALLRDVLLPHLIRAVLTRLV